MVSFFRKYKSILLYAFSLVVILIALQLLQYKLLLVNHSYELYILCIAIVFTGLGIWLALKIMKPKIQTIIVEKNIVVKELTEHDLLQIEKQKQQLGLSSREMEVLQLMAQGLSNQEIADRLFLSLPTIKSHSSNLFFKLDVNRRTQAIEKARQLKIID